MKRKFVAIITILVLLITMAQINTFGVYAETKQPLIPRDAVLFENHAYKVFDIGMSWADANKMCAELGGYLATITSQNEQNFITYELIKANRNSYWLGGYESGGVWHWTTNEPFSFTNWSYDQPDNSYRSGGEDHLMIYRNSNPLITSNIGEWNDLNISGYCGDEEFFGPENFGFVCEWGRTYTITYKLNGGNNDLRNPKKYAVDAATIS